MQGSPLAPSAWGCQPDAMSTTDLRQRLRASAEHLDQVRLQARYLGLEVIAIAGAPTGEPLRIGGEVEGLEVVPRSGCPWLEVVITDGTGSAVAIFTGAQHIHGLDPGRGVLLEGVARLDRNRLTFLNPAYTLLPA